MTKRLSVVITLVLSCSGRTNAPETTLIDPQPYDDSSWPLKYRPGDGDLAVGREDASTSRGLLATPLVRTTTISWSVFDEVHPGLEYQELPHRHVRVFTYGMPLPSVVLVMDVTSETGALEYTTREWIVPSSSAIFFEFPVPEDIPQGRYRIRVETRSTHGIARPESFRPDGDDVDATEPDGNTLVAVLEMDVEITSPEQLPPDRWLVARFQEVNDWEHPKFVRGARKTANRIQEKIEGTDLIVVLYGYADKSSKHMKAIREIYHCKLAERRTNTVRAELIRQRRELSGRIEVFPHGESDTPSYGANARRVEYSLMTPAEWDEASRRKCTE